MFKKTQLNLRQKKKKVQVDLTSPVTVMKLQQAMIPETAMSPVQVMVMLLVQALAQVLVMALAMAMLVERDHSKEQP